MSETYGTFSTAYVEAMRLRLSALEPENKGLAARVAELESENKAMRKRAELADGDIKSAQAILDASNRYIRRIEVELQRESQAKIDAEFHVAALKERLAATEARCKRMQEIGDMIVDEYLVERAERDAWQQAKEAKP